MNKEAKLLAFREILEVIAEYMNDVGYWRIEGFVKKPQGTKQSCDCPLFDHEYVNQSCGPCGDDYTGSFYLPWGNEYLEIQFEC